MHDNYYCLQEPAAEVRLLDLLPPTPSGNLQCSVTRVSIGKMPKFIAISHVWGIEKSFRPLKVDSECGIKDVSISRNLESLLLSMLAHEPGTIPQLWDGYSRLPMWIDMACINQTDVHEKNVQIPLMPDIYTQARSVIIWLNESSALLRYAFQYLKKALRSKTGEESDSIVRFDPIGWDGIKELMNCQWFRRRWVIHEAILSRDVNFLCGTDMMPMWDLFRAVDVIVDTLLARPKPLKEIYDANTGTTRPLRTLRDLKTMYTEGKKQWKLLWMLENLRSTAATLAHDQVYALLGLCSSEEVRGNSVRYDLEPEDVYQNSTISHIAIHGDSEFLALCTLVQRDTVTIKLPEGGLQSRSYEGPTWVPNWHSKHLRRCLGFDTITGDQLLFTASRTISMTTSIEHNRLSVSGILIDKIKALGSFSHRHRSGEFSDPNSEILQQYFDFWISATVSQNLSYASDTHKAKAFIRTITLHGVYLNPFPSDSELIAYFICWCRGSVLFDRLQKLGIREVTSSGWNHKSTFVAMRRLLSCQPFITEQGYFGLAREGCQIGDEVWVVGGCSVPILLSPSSDRTSDREVRGEVFIDGFMFGERLEGMEGKVQSVTLI